MTTADFASTRGTADLLATWTRGWAASRGVAPPRPDGDGWRIEVGLPEQVRRHVFPRLSPALVDHAQTIGEPWVYLKACVHANQLRAALPGRWTVQAPSYFMRFDGDPPPPASLADGYALTLEPERPGVLRALVHAPDGALAADGRVALVDDAAIFDRIGTAEPHRRRGLGRAVMGALHAAARDVGATRGLLAATQAGHALYTTFGWRVQAPYASAVIAGDSVGG